MNIRKLVKSGSTSHTIALPKDWLTKNNLKKGDMLYIKEENNEINISSEEKKPTLTTKEIGY